MVILKKWVGKVFREVRVEISKVDLWLVAVVFLVLVGLVVYIYWVGSSLIK